MNHSEKNIEIIRKMINRENVFLQNFISELLQKGYEDMDLPQWDEVTNLYSAEVNGEEYYSQEEINERMKEIEEMITDLDLDIEKISTPFDLDRAIKDLESYLDDPSSFAYMPKIWTYVRYKQDFREFISHWQPILSEYEDLENAELEQAEIYQWFHVSGWLANKLDEVGECILEWNGNYWWGRQACGMAIYYDGCFYRIAEEMEILEGMKYEW